MFSLVTVSIRRSNCSTTRSTSSLVISSYSSFALTPPPRFSSAICALLVFDAIERTGKFRQSRLMRKGRRTTGTHDRPSSLSVCCGLRHEFHAPRAHADKLLSRHGDGGEAALNPLLWFGRVRGG